MAKSSASQMRESLATANKRPNKPTGTAKLKLHSVTFKPADGGMISETKHTTDDSQYPSDSNTTTAVHSSLSHAQRHLGDTFKGQF